MRGCAIVITFVVSLVIEGGTEGFLVWKKGAMARERRREMREGGENVLWDFLTSGMALREEGGRKREGGTFEFVNFA